MGLRCGQLGSVQEGYTRRHVRGRRGRWSLLVYNEPGRGFLAMMALVCRQRPLQAGHYRPESVGEREPRPHSVAHGH